MKRALVFGFLSLLVSITVDAQVFTSEEKNKISEAKKQMDQTELSQMTEAETNFEEAQFALESISSEEYKVDQSFKSGASSKNEKKAVNVKRTKIEASKKNEKGFTSMYEAMETRLGKLPFNPDNKQKVKDLRAQSADKMSVATVAIEDYKFRDDKDLETYAYATLKEKTTQANDAFKEAIMLDIRAFELFNEQTLSVVSPEATASTESSSATTSSTESSSVGVTVSSEPVSQSTSETTSPAVVEVSSSAPSSESSSNSSGVVVETASSNETSNPAPVSVETTPTSVSVETNTITPSNVSVEASAPQPIAEVAPTPVPTSASVSYNAPEAKASIAPKAKKAAPAPLAKKPAVSPAPTASVAKAPQSGGVVYRVQIIAVSKGPLSEVETKKLYAGTEKIYEEQEGGFYKYCIGDFTSSGQAQRLKESLAGDSFVVKYRDGKRVQ